MSSREQTFFTFAQRAPAPRRRSRNGQPRAARQARRMSSPDVHQGRLPLLRPIDELARLRLQRRIGAHLVGDLLVQVTDNRYSIISIKRIEGRYEARLHHMFLEADSRIVRALARYISRNDPAASELISAYIDQNQDKIRHTLPQEPRPLRLQPRGRCFDLLEIFDHLNVRYFQGRVEAGITWGRRRCGPPRRHRSMKMGSYSVDDRLIRIHAALDRPFVPRFFLESVVFHEMLHQVHDIPLINGRHAFHTAEFRRHEQRFDYHEAAERWERENLSRLLYY